MSKTKLDEEPEVEETEEEVDLVELGTEIKANQIELKARLESTVTTEKFAELEGKWAATQDTLDKVLARQNAPLITVDDKGPYSKLTEFMRDVKEAGKAVRFGGPLPEKLVNWVAGHASESHDEQGGYLVPAEFVRDLFSKDYMEQSLAARCRVLPVAGNTVSIPTINETSRQTGARWGGVQGYWIDEMAAKTPTKPTFDLLTLTLHEFAVFGYATNQLLTDSFITFEAFLRQAFESEAQWMVEDAIINGLGAGMPLGILLAGCLLAVPRDPAQAFPRATVITENILAMYAACWPPSWPNTVWLINTSVIPQLLSMSLAVGAGGGPTYLPPGGLSASPYGTLLGRPVIPCEHLPILGTVGDIVLADFSQYAIISKTGAFDTSVHLRFNYDETAFRFTLRVDGQPLWRVPITAADGVNTYSPFVVVAL